MFVFGGSLESCPVPIPLDSQPEPPVAAMAGRVSLDPPLKHMTLPYGGVTSCRFSSSGKCESAKPFFSRKAKQYSAASVAFPRGPAGRMNDVVRAPQTSL